MDQVFEIIGVSKGVVVVLSILTYFIVNYMLRLRDHIREEHRITESHFSRVKEVIRDELEQIGALASRNAKEILDEVENQQINCENNIEADCTVSNRMGDLDKKLQLSRYMRTMDHYLDNKLYTKITGWMRENGFNNMGRDSLQNYIQSRARQANITESQVNNRIVELCPDIMRSKKAHFPAKEMTDAMERIVEFTIHVYSEINRDIKKYRTKQGGKPVALIKKILFSRRRTD